MTKAFVSPYACAKIVNEWLKEDGVEKKLPPQMFYQYTSDKKGYIKTVLTDEGKKCVDTDDLRSWYDEKYMKRAAVVEVDEDVEVDENQLELDFDES